MLYFELSGSMPLVGSFLMESTRLPSGMPAEFSQPTPRSSARDEMPAGPEKACSVSALYAHSQVVLKNRSHLMHVAHPVGWWCRHDRLRLEEIGCGSTRGSGGCSPRAFRGRSPCAETKGLRAQGRYFQGAEVRLRPTACKLTSRSFFSILRVAGSPEATA